MTVEERLLGTSTSLERVTKRLLVHRIGPDRSFVFNAITGALDIAQDCEIDMLTEMQTPGASVALSAQERKFLTERGYLYRSLAEEEAVLERRVEVALHDNAASAPAIYSVCPTLACNLDCSYCFEGASSNKPRGIMSPDVAEQALDAIVELHAAHVAAVEGQGDSRADMPPAYLTLFGGEPLLPATRQVVAQLMRGAADRGMMLGATTNGVNIGLFRELFAELSDVISGLQITLDGPKVIHDLRRHRMGGQGTFDEIVAGIDTLIEIGIDIDLRVNVDSTNMEHIPELCSFISWKGWLATNRLQVILAPITVHGDSACASSSALSALNEIEFDLAFTRLGSANQIVNEVCSSAHLRHLEYLVSILEPERRFKPRKGADGGTGARYWYCEATSGSNWVLTPDGFLYACTEGVGKPEHAIGRFAPELDVWSKASREWQRKTILSHPKCRQCNISTLCGGGCHMGARSVATSERDNVPGLIQLDVRKHVGRASPNALRPTEQPVSPFCAGAEQIVREYLDSAGKRLLLGLRATNITDVVVSGR